MKKQHGYILACLLFSVCMCYDPANPFLNSGEAQAVFHQQSFRDGDTVYIYSTKSFSVVVNFPEYVRGYAVHVDNNRLWKFSDSVMSQAQMLASPMDFRFSFSDTGTKNIVITTYGKNGAEKIARVKLFAKSPLHQEQIVATRGDSITLQTPSVADSVTYTWDLRNGEIIRSNKPMVRHCVKNSFVGSKGELYVSGSETDKSSPVIFSIVDPDLAPLVVTYTPQIPVNDTIVVSTSSYKFLVKLEGAKSLKAATVNAKELKIESSIDGIIMLSTIIDSLDRGSLVKLLAVNIQDGYDRTFLDTVYIKFKPENSNNCTITVFEPADSQTVHDSLLHIYGILSGSTADSSKAIYATVNTSKPVAGKLNQKVWSFTLNLLPGWNTIIIESFTDSSSSRIKTASIIHHVFLLPNVTFACVNDSVSGDTIFTGNPYLDFGVIISSSFQIKNATVNSERFDNEYSVGTNTFRYSKYFSGLDTSVIKKVVIQVSSQNDQVYEHTYFIRYRVGVITSRPHLTILVPANDSIVTNEKQYRIHGSIKNHLQYGDVYLFASLYGVPLSGYSRVDKDSMWNFSVALNEGWNEIVVDVYEDSLKNGTSLTKGTIHIKYVPQLIDTLAPVVIAVRTANDIEVVDGMIFSTTELPLKIKVSDNVKPTSVVIDNRITAQTVDSFNFTCTVPLSHAISNELKITAYDKKGNNSTIKRRICYNRIPHFALLPEARTLYVDSMYTFQVKVTDGDHDNIRLTAKINRALQDTIISIGSNGYFSWKPVLSDIGRMTITFVAWDGYQQTEQVVSMNVVKSKLQVVPVKWLTKSQEFPAKCIAGVDTLSKLILVDTLTGMKPFSFSALIDGELLPFTKVNSFTARVTWAPTESNVGIRTLRFIVKDSAGSSDTLQVLLQIDKRPPVYIRWRPTTASYNEQMSSTEKKVFAHLSAPARERISVSCVVDWISSTAKREDFSIKDTMYLVFNKGDTTASVSFRIINDTELEKDETIDISFSKMPDYVRVNAGSRFTGTIVDDDKVSYTFENSGGNAPESVSEQKVRVRLSKVVPYAITLTCTIDPSSTAKPDDYSIQTPSITIPANTGYADLRFTVNNDPVYENDETVILKISSKDQRALAGTVTTYVYSILNDDHDQKTVTFSGHNQFQIYENDVDGAMITVNLSQQVGVRIVVRYEIGANSSATKGIDYTLAPSDSVVFEPYETGKTIKVTPIDDQQANEVGEFFQITLKSVSNTDAVRIGNVNITKTVFIHDND